MVLTNNHKQQGPLSNDEGLCYKAVYVKLQTKSIGYT